MKTLNYLIVKSKTIYNNDDGGFIDNTSVESVSNINRDVEVVAAPDFTPIKKGDRVIIHHNILRFRNSMKGRVVQSNYFIGYEGGYTLYFVPLTEVFMFKKDDNDWESLDPYCFVKPIGINSKESLVLDENDSNEYKGNLKHQGIVIYTNKELRELNVNNGDRVIFSNYSEYEFKINNEILYKMSTKDILLKI